ncbi:MAG: hypothetical protein UX65_C0006G0019 [Parcubacteria group bacterium GW2011_GWB1_46_8]|nr:MAG: hypothetical protein UX14_C0007G0020 [Parcubacteria group bacterium GW2011_GWF1_45_5]KKU46254.1 MAG: hypothetical protein UX65_C0006G0019 [Parcubacteria group bacterium GW2011_GWB1_46_8]
MDGLIAHGPGAQSQQSEPAQQPEPSQQQPEPVQQQPEQGGWDDQTASEQGNLGDTGDVSSDQYEADQ